MDGGGEVPRAPRPQREGLELYRWMGGRPALTSGFFPSFSSTMRPTQTRKKSMRLT